MSTPLDNLAKLGLSLPQTSSPIANYVNAVRTGNLIYLSGKGPLLPDNTYITGKVGAEVSIEQGYEAARLCGLHHLAVLQSE